MHQFQNILEFSAVTSDRNDHHMSGGRMEYFATCLFFKVGASGVVENDAESIPSRQFAGRIFTTQLSVQSREQVLLFLRFIPHLAVKGWKKIEEESP